MTRALRRRLDRLAPRHSLERTLLIVEYEGADGATTFAYAVEFQPGGSMRRLDTLAEVEVYRQGDHQ